MARDLFEEAGIVPKERDLFAEAGIKPELSGMEEFYRTSGIHGMNRAFGRAFAFGPELNRSEEAYQQAVQTHPIATEFGNAFGQIAASAPFIAAGNVGAAGIPGLNAAGQSIIGSMIGQGAYAAQRQPEEGQTRFGNVMREAPEAGLMAGALEMAGPTYNKGKELIQKIPYSKTKIAESINNDFNVAKNKYKELYDTFFETTKKQNIKTDLALPRSIKKATQGMGSEVRSVVKKAFKSNNPEYVHDAQSKLAEFIRHELKTIKPDREAIGKAKELRATLNKQLHETLSKNNPELAKKYKEISQGYKKEVVPYSKNRSIKKYNAGEWTERDLVKSLQGDSESAKSFRKHLAKKYPGVKVNQILDYAFKATLGGAGSIGGYGAYKYFVD